MKALAVLLGINVVGFLSTACGGPTESGQSEFRIYDPSGRVPIEVTSTDIVRSSARALPQPGGSAVVFVAFTDDGASKFCRLTRALARRGAALEKRQRFAVEIDNRVGAQPFIDYEASPSGVCGVPGMEMTVRRLADALRLARIIREGTD